MTLDLSIDIGALSQLVFGRFSVKDLAYQGRLEILKPGSEKVLSCDSSNFVIITLTNIIDKMAINE